MSTAMSRMVKDSKLNAERKKNCQYMLNRKYQIENATSDKNKSIILTNL